MREDTENITRERSSSVETEGTYVLKNLEEIVRRQSEKENNGYKRQKEERLQRIEKAKSSAPRLTKSSTASFPGRNEGPGIHCSLIVKKERENSSCQIC